MVFTASNWIAFLSVTLLIVGIGVPLYVIYIKRGTETGASAVILANAIGLFGVVFIAASIIGLLWHFQLDFTENLYAKENEENSRIQVSLFDRYKYRGHDSTIEDFAYSTHKGEICNKDNDYDYISIVAKPKSITFPELLKYLHSPSQLKVFSVESKYVVASKKIVLNGLLKTQVNNDEIEYHIGEYKLTGQASISKDALKALSNNQKVNLEILYNVNNYKNDKYLSDFMILNARTL